MIYVLEKVDCEYGEVIAVYQTDEPMDLTHAAFLCSLGLRPRPKEPIRGQYQDWEAWLAQHREWRAANTQWLAEKHSVLVKNGLGTDHFQYEAHRAWIESLPGVKKLDFETI